MMVTITFVRVQLLCFGVNQMLCRFVFQEQSYEIRPFTIEPKHFLLERARAHRGRCGHDGALPARIHACLRAAGAAKP